MTTSTCNTEHPLYAILAQERAFLLPHWRDKALLTLHAQTSLASTPVNTPDKGMCRFTAAYLQAVLKQRGFNLAIAGGSPWPPTYPTGGFLASDGQWYGHYWLTDGQYIFDITASQFGAEDIVITPIDDPRYQANFSKQELREHLTRIKNTLASWKKARKTYTI